MVDFVGVGALFTTFVVVPPLHISYIQLKNGRLTIWQFCIPKKPWDYQEKYVGVYLYIEWKQYCDLLTDLATWQLFPLYNIY